MKRAEVVASMGDKLFVMRVSLESFIMNNEELITIECHFQDGYGHEGEHDEGKVIMCLLMSNTYHIALHEI